MNFEQLHYIVEVAKMGSISIAAENLHVSQAAVSQGITNLEKELNMKLFNRSRRYGSIPTDQGKEVIKIAYEIIDKAQKIVDLSQASTNLSRGNLTIAAIPSLLMTYLPKALSKFKEDNPLVEIETMEKRTQEILNDIKNEKIDLGFIALHQSQNSIDDDLIFKRLKVGQMKVCVSKNSPLAFSDSLSALELKDQPIVMYNGDTLKSAVNTFFKDFEDINILLSSNNTKVIQKFVADGIAISFLFDLTIENEHYILNGEVIPVPLTSNPQIDISYGWVYLKKNNLSYEAKTFLNYL